MRKKAGTLRALVAKADRTFSRFIRLRDADENGDISCCTCRRSLPWNESHACHFVRRQHMSVRWDERNVHAGCPKCNVFQGGNLDEYSAFIIGRYGMGTFNELLSKKHETKKWTRPELEELIQKYSERVLALENSGKLLS